MIAVDVDGVLGDTHTAIAPVLLDKHGVHVTAEDIVRYDFDVVEGVKIGPIIWAAFDDEAFVAQMPVLEGSAQMLNALAKIGRVVIVTARPPHADDWTRSWLSKNTLTFDELIISSEGAKSSCGAHVLIDDYLGNIVEFLENTDGSAVLLSRPWNRDRDELAPWLENGRAEVAESHESVPDRVKTLVAAALDAR